MARAQPSGGDGALPLPRPPSPESQVFLDHYRKVLSKLEERAPPRRRLLALAAPSATQPPAFVPQRGHRYALPDALSARREMMREVPLPADARDSGHAAALTYDENEARREALARALVAKGDQLLGRRAHGARPAVGKGQDQDEDEGEEDDEDEEEDGEADRVDARGKFERASRARAALRAESKGAGERDTTSESEDTGSEQAGALKKLVAAGSRSRDAEATGASALRAQVAQLLEERERLERAWRAAQKKLAEDHKQFTEARRTMRERIRELESTQVASSEVAMVRVNELKADVTALLARLRDTERLSHAQLEAAKASEQAQRSELELARNELSMTRDRLETECKQWREAAERAEMQRSQLRATLDAQRAEMETLAEAAERGRQEQLRLRQRLAEEEKRRGDVEAAMGRVGASERQRVESELRELHASNLALQQALHTHKDKAAGLERQLVTLREIVDRQHAELAAAQQRSKPAAAAARPAGLAPLFEDDGRPSLAPDSPQWPRSPNAATARLSITPVAAMPSRASSLGGGPSAEQLVALQRENANLRQQLQALEARAAAVDAAIVTDSDRALLAEAEALVRVLERIARAEGHTSAALIQALLEEDVARAETPAKPLAGRHAHTEALRRIVEALAGVRNLVAERAAERVGGECAAQ